MPADPSGLVVISLGTQLRSSQYPVIAWDVRGMPADAEVRLLWRTDYAPAKMNAMPVVVSGGRLLPIDVHRDPALARQRPRRRARRPGHLGRPVRIRGLIAYADGAARGPRDRLRRMAGPSSPGAVPRSIPSPAASDDQSLPLPALLFAALVLTSLSRAASPGVVVTGR